MTPADAPELTWEDVEAEVEKIGGFFGQLPEDLRPGAAERLIGEIVIFGACSHYGGIGILMEAMLRYREASLEVLEQEKGEGGETLAPEDKT